jgi:uncharacterized protein (DUF2147 family)
MKHSVRLSASSLALLFCAFGSMVPAAAADAMDPHGLWLRPEGGVRFSFYDCENGLLCAKVVGAENPADQAGIGTVILRGAKKIAANEWRGTLYNSENGKSYDGYITVKGNGDELSVKGCLLGFLCGGETWKRIPAAAPGPVGAAKSPVKSVAAAAE